MNATHNCQLKEKYAQKHPRTVGAEILVGATYWSRLGGCFYGREVSPMRGNNLTEYAMN